MIWEEYIKLLIEKGINKGEIINKSLVDEIKKVSSSSKMGSYGYGVMVSDKL